MCVQKSKYVTLSSAFSSRYVKTRTSDFRKVVRQHTEGMVGSTIFCLKFTWLSSSEKMLKIRSELTKLSPWVRCTTFVGHSVHMRYNNNNNLCSPLSVQFGSTTRQFCFLSTKVYTIQVFYIFLIFSHPPFTKVHKKKINKN